MPPFFFFFSFVLRFTSFVFLVGCKTRSRKMIETRLPGEGGAEHSHLVA